jgi:ADP-ribose pyrophosphatase YjhB (NUDIX family)
MIEIRVGVIIIENGKILLVKHSKNNREYWVIPGGRVKTKETLKEAAEREIREELNLEINLKKLLYVKEIILKNRHILNIFFLAKRKRGKLLVKPTPVLKEGRFFPVDMLDKIKFLPPIAKTIKNSCKKNFKEGGKYLF